MAQNQNLVFKTPEDYPYDHEIVGVGVAHSRGRGGVTLERGAEKMPELQDALGEPLTGKKLEDAGKAFAEERGLEVVKVSDTKLAKLPQEAGSAPERPDAIKVAEEAYRVQYEGEEPVQEGASVEDAVTEAPVPSPSGAEVPATDNQEG